MKKAIFLIAIILISFGCKTPKPITNNVYHTKIEKETIRDTIIDIQIKEMFIEKISKDTISELSTKNAHSLAKYSNGLLYHSLEQSGVQATKVLYKDKITIDTIYKEEVRFIEVEKNLSWWQSFFMGMGKLFLLLVSIWVVYIVIKVIK